MATYAIVDNGDEYLELTINGTIVRLIKKAYVKTTVSEPYMFLHHHNQERSGSRYTLKLDFNDVTSPAEASATALKTTVDAMLAAGGTPYTDEMAQDAVGNVMNTEFLEYDDATPAYNLTAKSRSAINLFNHINLSV